MLALESLRNLARGLGRGGFAARFANGFLLRRAGAELATPEIGEGEGGEDADGSAFNFHTSLIQRDDLPLDLLDGELPDPSGWVVLSVAKRRGNPFPDRISVGRARNCDLVLRYPSVSKLHAHFRLVDGRVSQLTDYESVNGTFVNGERVTAGGGGAKVKLGDRVRFGAMELEYVSAEEVFELVMQLPARDTRG